MRHRAKGRQLSRTASHKKALLANLATSLFRHDRIVTTEAKAKELRPYAERLITLARRGDLHARRLVERRLKDKAVTTRSEEHTSELQSHSDLVCRLLLEKKKKTKITRSQRHNDQRMS